MRPPGEWALGLDVGKKPTAQEFHLSAAGLEMPSSVRIANVY